MLSAERVAQFVREQREHGTGQLLVFWCQVLANREEFAQAVRRASQGLPVVALVVRDDGFTNPNSLLSDLTRLLDNHRSLIEEVWGGTADGGPLVIVLLSRTALSVPQLSSPTVLPTWFPRGGGETIDVLFEDLNRSAAARLNAIEVRLDELCGALFRVEEVCRRRLWLVLQQDHNAGNALFAFIRDEKKAGETYRTFLEGAELAAQHVQSAEAFRPSARDGITVIARLLRLAGKTSPDEITSRANALANALMLPAEGGVDDALVTVLFRPVVRNPNPAADAARNILAVVFATSQLVTAGAHADAYPTFPVLLLQSLSYDLRRALHAICDSIEALQNVTAV